jgi:Damage-control phosphatase ARMT1-like domain
LGAPRARPGGGGEEEEWVRWVHALVLRSLWGNRADLSMSGGEVEGVPHAKVHREKEEGEDEVVGRLRESGLVRDDAWELARRLCGARGVVVVALDNAGPEFLCDLLLTYAVLELGRAERVELHVKTDPVFVSDVTEQDVQPHIDFLAAHPVYEGVAASLRGAVLSGRLCFRAFALYCSPARSEEAVAAAYGAADVVVLKGDANYRRLTEDRRWDPATPLRVAWGPRLAALPCVASLRTLKSESLAGIRPEVLAAAPRVFGDDWRVSGEVGAISVMLGGEEAAEAGAAGRG